ncbi:ABC transporter substrate-binding protein [Rhodoplanes sp. TEM]|uniref:ABC transporter substrate-binding protein n=1 Tax=Rhodoplanes tepidamans TaxID=200616 RepID=A0ABT5JGP7_RHOTP|nr:MULTISPECIES: ABC transporter substrate-binding protein [Rhodoplanes]MDC7788890.1 ABC transporter substrate-binding protein [Rhodoplanes tepidamans]MDC7985597.1 ABC transporter substrate-binding protein [Rhodoplanes sp. TEM]MDQ0358776.1 NitT/TauT family transport system substrate-binding protein [Rhodoplanes tepidamans]
MKASGRLLAVVGAVLSLAGAPATGRAADVLRIGEGPFITGGGFLVAEQKGYFKRVGIDVEKRMFIDGQQAVPALIAGELDLTFMTANASLFNSIARGAPLVVVLDRGNNKAGRGYTVINVSKEMADAGVKTLGDLGRLKGKKIGVSGTGSINQYVFSLALQKAGLDPRKDVTWVTNVPQPDLMKMLGQNQIDATDLAYQFGFFAEKNGWGPMIATGDKIDPDGPIGVFATRQSLVREKRDVLVRFAMAYLQGAKEFNAAAAAPDQHPEIVDILARTTALQKPETVKAIAPNWSYVNEDGLPNVTSIMKMQDYWADYYDFVEKKVSAERLFDLTIAKEALARLEREKPFAK